VATEILPTLRGAVSSNRRVVAHYTDSDDAVTFAGSQWAKELSALGTSCPDHFLRTRISPLFVNWNPKNQDVSALKASIQSQMLEYVAAYKAYYRLGLWAIRQSCGIRILQ
jgi:rhamnose utilization protein RhaD (predicted bifunctional aldolase and dehydrogenase)